MEIDYNKIKFFLAVVECGGITKAAKELYRTQSAVSQAIQSLEQQLGCKLITWEGKQLQLTREGKLVFEAAADRLRTLDGELQILMEYGEEVAGSIEIGMLLDHSTKVHSKLFQAVGEFQQKYPKVSFRFRLGTSSAIEQALIDQEIDMGILINFQSIHRFTLVELATEEHIVVTSKKSPKSVKEVIESALIDIDTNFVCFSPWVEYHDPESFKQLQKKKPAIVVPDFLAIKELLLSGTDIAVMPKYLVEKELKNKSLVQVLPKLRALRVWVNCAIIRGRKLRPSEELFLNFIKDLF